VHYYIHVNNDNLTYHLKVGDYVQFVNLHAQVAKPSPTITSMLAHNNPQVELCIHRGTSYNRHFKVLDPLSDDVLRLKRTLDDVAAMQRRSPTADFCQSPVRYTVKKYTYYY